MIFNKKMFNFFSANKLISKNHSGFVLADSGINQLLSITGDILTSVCNGLEVKSIFRHI